MDMLAKAIVFEAGYSPGMNGIIPTPEVIEVMEKHSHPDVTVERTSKKTWAIRHAGRCLTKKGQWEYERMPSSRPEAFVKRTRFDSAEKAMNFFVKWAQKKTKKLLKNQVFVKITADFMKRNGVDWSPK